MLYVIAGIGDPLGFARQAYFSAFSHALNRLQMQLQRSFDLRGLGAGDKFSFALQRIFFIGQHRLGCAREDSERSNGNCTSAPDTFLNLIMLLTLQCVRNQT